MAGVITALIALCHTPAQEVRAQASSKRGRQVKAASRLARSQPKEENEKARELVEEGLGRADQKDWVKAFEAFNQALAISPRYGDAYIAMGDAYMDMGKYAESFKAYKQAISVEASNPDAYYSLGAAYNSMAQYGDSFKYFVQAIQLDPDFAEAHYGIGYAYLKLENFKAALVYLRNAARLKPDYWEAHLALGQTYLGLQDVKAAEKELKILAGLDASAAGDLEKEIRKSPGIAKLPDRTELDGRSESAPLPREKSVTTNTAQEQSDGRPSRPAAQNQSGIPANSPVSTPKPTASSGDAGLAVELSFWESIKNSGDPEEFAAYLNKYPEGQFAELARIRMRAFAGKKGEASGEKTAPKPQTPVDNTAAPGNLPKPISQTLAYDAAAQQPKEQLSAEPPVKDQSVREKEQPKEQPAVEKPKSNEVDDAADAATVEAALDSLRRLLPSKFSYRVSAAGEASAGGAFTSEININYELLKFEGCTVKWRDQNDTLSMALTELDPEAVRVEPLNVPGATLSIGVWNVSISSAGGKGAISEVKGNGSGTVNRYNGLNLQYDNEAKAESLARVLRQAIRLCRGKP
jgi:tetratricopeptide (TPR) repeat protein